MSPTMKAAWYERIGPARDVLQIGRLPVPEPGVGEVRVRVYASGINPSDNKRRSGFGGIKMPYPRIIPHHDGAGVIDKLGPGVPASRLGQRVWVYEATFAHGAGTAAEYTVVPANNAMPLPDSVSFEVGATLGVVAITAHWALFCDGSIAGRTVLVPGGGGGVGSTAIQLARWGGASMIIATVSRREQATVAKAAGADHIIDRKREPVVERVMELTSGAGVDRIIEVSPEQNFETGLKVIKPAGTIAIYASDSAESELRTTWLPMLLKAVKLHFNYVPAMPLRAKQDALRDVNAALGRGALSPHIGATMILDEIAAAHELQDSGRLVGKIVLRINA